MPDWAQNIEPKEFIKEILKDTSTNKIKNAEKFYKAIEWNTCNNEYMKEIIKCA